MSQNGFFGVIERYRDRMPMEGIDLSLIHI